MAGYQQKATLGCVGSSGGSERESPLPSLEVESTSSVDVDGLELATSDESRGAVPKIGTSVRVSGGAGVKRRVHFALIPRIIPDAWFQLQSECARFSSREDEEQLRSKLQGFAVEDVEPGRGRHEATTEKKETEHPTEDSTAHEPDCTTDTTSQTGHRTDCVTDAVSQAANQTEGETESEAKDENETESESESVSEQGEATGEVPTAEK